MKSLRWFFGLDRVYFSKSISGFFYDGVVFLLLTGFAINFILNSKVGHGIWILIAISITISLLVLREIVQSIYVWRRISSLNDHYWVVPNSIFYDSTLHRKNQDKGISTTVTRLINNKEDWLLYDVIVNFYRKTKYGKYIDKRLTQTIFEVKLQRKVPNLVFDNKQAHGRQFRLNFLKSQKLNFEAVFDEKYDSYAPHTYQVDALSFISPEVLEAMIGIKNADIEFIGDRMLCYGPLIDEQYLNIFKEHCLKLYFAVNNNLDTYRDDRLAGQARREDVTLFAKRLLESPYKYIFVLCISAISSMAFIFVGLYLKNNQVILNQFSILIYILFVTYIYKTAKIIRYNKKAENEFRQHLEIMKDINNFNKIQDS